MDKCKLQAPDYPVEAEHYKALFTKAKGGNCPICGAGTNSVTYTYCRKCGQALDWSGDND